MALQLLPQRIMLMINEFREITLQPAVKIFLLLVVFEFVINVENVFVLWVMLTIATVVLLGLEHGFNWIFTKSSYFLLFLLALITICITLESILNYLSNTYSIIMTIKGKYDNGSN